MKKTIIIMCIMVSLLFAGCKVQQNTDSTASGSDGTKTSEATQDDGKKEVTKNLDLSQGIEKNDEGVVETEFYTVTLPEKDSWDFEKNSDGTITFYNKAAREAGYGGIIFTLKTLASNNFNLLSEDFLIAGDTHNNLIIADFPSDVQYNAKDSKMAKDYKTVYDEARKIGSDNSPVVVKKE